MIQPPELKLNLPMTVAGNAKSNTTQVWLMLQASYDGDLQKVKSLVSGCPGLIYAQYNYTPPIHFAVREGHLDLVAYLLEQGAYDPVYKTYPFSDNLHTIAQDRGYEDIALLLKQYEGDTSRQRFKGDNGEIHYERTALQLAFQSAVDKADLDKTEAILKQHPGFALDETYFWGEGILTFAAKENNRRMVDLLMSFGAKVPDILKWTQFYYFERLDGATYMMEKGMNPNTMSWHHVTVLHDMAQKGDIARAKLLIDHGATIDPVEEEYQSTPLGMAARWGQLEMVEYLLAQGADPNKSGATWSTPMAWALSKRHDEIAQLLKQYG